MEKSIKIKSKFYSKLDKDECVVISISINANHELNQKIVTKLESDINQLFVTDYINNDLYKQQKELENLDKETQKQNKKYQDKTIKMQLKVAKSEKPVATKKNKYELD
jgi:hypothetical protein